MSKNELYKHSERLEILDLERRGMKTIHMIIHHTNLLRVEKFAISQEADTYTEANKIVSSKMLHNLANKYIYNAGTKFVFSFFLRSLTWYSINQIDLDAHFSQNFVGATFF